MDFFKSFLEGEFDPASLLPDLSGMMGPVELMLRLLVLAGPVVLLVLGVLYFLLPTREANHHFGYQFFWGKASMEAWRFQQKVAGLVWAVLGLVLAVVAFISSRGFAGVEAMDMVWSAVRCILWQLGLVAVSVVVIDITVVVMYSSKGKRRKFGKEK